MARTFPGNLGFPLCLPSGSLLFWTLVAPGDTTRQLTILDQRGRAVVDAAAQGAENLVSGQFPVTADSLYRLCLPGVKQVELAEAMIYGKRGIVARSYTVAGNAAAGSPDPIAVITCLTRGRARQAE